MLSTLFLFSIGIASLYSITNWRRGIYLMILIGIIKDPIRKMIPGAPPYLALATVPIWAGILIGALIENPQLWQGFRNSYKRLSMALIIFVASLLPAAVRSATYGAGSWEVTLVGLFSYFSVILGILIGYIYPKYEKDLKNIIILYCVVTAIMLIGTPMEYLGVAKGWNALGTAAMKHTWLQYSVYGSVVRMYAGFYRSPDVMGWHATILSMFAIILAVRSSGRDRYFWIFIAGWGLMGGILCGRRKMIFMLPAFVSVLCLLYWRLQRRIKFSTLIAIILISSGTGFLMYHEMGPSTAIEKYYTQDPSVILGRVEKHGFEALVTTYRQSGVFGEGLGTATQGIHRLNVSKPRTWQEGGLGRILVELGVPGFVCFLFLSFALISSMWDVIVKKLGPSSADFVFRAGLIALFAANAISFVVSHQIFGDPFVICFFSLLIGFILSKAPMRVPARKRVIRPKLRNSGSVSDLENQGTMKPSSLLIYRAYHKTWKRKNPPPHF